MRGVRIFETVTPVDHAIAEQMVVSARAISLPSAEAASFEVGDVLVSDHGDGLFRVIESIQDQGAITSFTTRPALLEDAIAEGQIYLGKIVEGQGEPPIEFTGAARTAESQLRQQGLFSKDWSGELFSYDRDFTGQLNARLSDPHIEGDQGRDPRRTGRRVLRLDPGHVAPTVYPAGAI